MIGRMLATDVISAARTWRPAEFGNRRAGDIDEALVEPLWTGPRVLAVVQGDTASMTDETGGRIEGREEVEAELVEAAGGATLLLEGVLTPEPLQGVDEVAARDAVQVPTPGALATQMLVGDRLAKRGEMDARLGDLRRREFDNRAIEVAFVAVDLLWIDDQSILDVPLLERKRVLESALRESRLVRLSVYVRPPIDNWLTSWRMFGFRRLSFRGANSRYVPGARNPEWAQAEIPRR
jgi:hypothetical protein